MPRPGDSVTIDCFPDVGHDTRSLRWQQTVVICVAIDSEAEQK